MNSFSYKTGYRAAPLKKLTALLLAAALMFCAGCAFGEKGDSPDHSVYTETSGRESGETQTVTETPTVTAESTDFFETEATGVTEESLTAVTQTEAQTVTASSAPAGVTSSSAQQSSTAEAGTTKAQKSAPETEKPGTTAPRETRKAPESSTAPAPFSAAPSAPRASEAYTPPEIPAGVFDKRFYYSRLTAAQKKLYEEAYSAASQGLPTYDCVYESANTKTDIEKSSMAFHYDFPEFCSLSGGYKYSYSTADSSCTVTLRTKSFCSDTSGGSYRTALTNKANQVVREAEQFGTAFDRIKYVHDYLCYNVIYDYDAMGKGDDTSNTSAQMAYTAYGALINGRAVCAGYSLAFEMMMRMLGYECGYVPGTAKGSHAWNVIKVGADYYYIDVTWDDDWEDDKKYIDYSYFCITSAEMNRSHTPDRDFSYPTASSNDLNFYYHYEYVVKTYDSETCSAVIEEQKNNEYIYIKFTDRNSYNQAKSGKNGLFDDVRRVTGKNSVSYYSDDEFYVLAFKS